MTGPATVRSSLSRFFTERRDVDQVCKDGWHDHKIAAIAIDDPRLRWPERQVIENVADRLYGKRQEER